MSFVKGPASWHQRWVEKKHKLRLVRITAVAASAAVIALLLHAKLEALFHI
jgi:hypothetical protein